MDGVAAGRYLNWQSLPSSYATAWHLYKVPEPRASEWKFITQKNVFSLEIGAKWQFIL